jgi:hypothetical protein
LKRFVSLPPSHIFTFPTVSCQLPHNFIYSTYFSRLTCLRICRLIRLYRLTIPVAIPIFFNDLATLTTANGTCGSGRIPLASAAFPMEEWPRQTTFGPLKTTIRWRAWSYSRRGFVKTLAPKLTFLTPIIPWQMCKPAWMASSSQLGWHHQASLDGIIKPAWMASSTRKLLPIPRNCFP